MKRFKTSKFIPAVLIFCLFFVLPNITFAAADFGNAMLESLAINAGFNTGKTLTAIIGAIIKIIISLFGIFTMIMMVYAGVLWGTSKGEVEKIEKAKKMIISGIIGMLIVISSYALTSFIIGKLTGIFGGNPYSETNNGESGGNSSGFGTGFNVVSTYPKNEAVSVKTCDRLSAMFNKNVLDSSVDNSSFFVRDEDENAFYDELKDAYYVNNKSVSFYHNNHDFDKYKIYRVTISNGLDGIRSTSGNTLERSKTIWFKTSETEDQMPRVKKSYPENNASEVCRNTVIQFEFQEGDDPDNKAEMDPTSFNLNNIILEECGSPMIANVDTKVCENCKEEIKRKCIIVDSSIISAITPKSDFSGVSISFKKALKENTTYRIILKSSINNPTLNPSDGIANSCGKPLDGNGNSIHDGTPEDDYQLVFNTGSTVDCSPVINSVEPVYGYYNDVFKITGDYFGIFGDVSLANFIADDNCSNSDPVDIYSVNDEDSCYVSWNNNEINVKVPFGSVSGKLKVVLTDEIYATYNQDFTVYSPYIASLTPGSGPVGEFIRIAGKNFKDSKSSKIRKVYFISMSGDVIEAISPEECKSLETWKENEIIIETPDVPLGYYAVIVEVDGHYSNYLIYRVIDGVPGPGLCGIVPSSEERGKKVKLEGVRFLTNDPKRDIGKVNFTGVEISKDSENISKWSEKVIELKVPENAIDGMVSVFVNEKESNPIYFNVLKYNAEEYPTIVESIGCEEDTRSPSPYFGTTDACTNMIPSVRFNVNMNISSFANNFEIYQCVGNDIECNTLVKGNIIAEGSKNSGYKIMAFKPNADFLANTWYKAIVKTGVKSTGNKNLQQEFVWTFKTRANGACEVDSLNLLPKNKTIYIGQSASLIAYPTSSLDRCVELSVKDSSYNWASEDSSKVRVSEKGIILETGSGQNDAYGIAETLGTRITAKFKGLDSISDTAIIIVEDDRYPHIIDSEGCEVDTRSPSPYSNAEGVCTNIIPEVRFNTDMDISTFSGNFIIEKCTGNGVGCNTTIAGIVEGKRNKIISFIPKKSLESNTWYRATIGTGVKTAASKKNLQEVYAWNFKTRAEGECEIDTLRLSPNNKVIYVGNNIEITAAPSSSIDKCATLYSSDAYYNWRSEDTSKIALASDNSIGVYGDGTGWAYFNGRSETDGTKVFAKYKETNIENFTTIIVENSKYVTVLNSSGCINEGTSKFSASRSPSPYNMSDNACRNIEPEITFNEDMDISSFTGNMELRKCDSEGGVCNEIVSGAAVKVGSSLRRIAFKPENILEANTWYQAIVKTGVKTLGTNKNLEREYTWKFKTKDEECKINALAMDPSEKEIKVNSYIDISAIPSSKEDLCAILFGSSDKKFTWSSEKEKKVSIVSTRVEDGIGVANVLGKETTDGVKITAKIGIGVSNYSNIIVTSNGIGNYCNNSLECNPGLCCDSENKCTNNSNICLPRIPDISSCSAEDAAHYSNVLSNPSPYKNKENVCNNANINIMFDMNMLADGSSNAVNNINNYSIIECKNNICGNATTPEVVKVNGTNNFITFIPRGGLKTGSKYTIKVKNNIVSINNKSLGTDYSWNFSVGKECNIDRVDSFSAIADENGIVNLHIDDIKTDTLSALLSSSDGKCLSLIAPNGTIYNWHTKDKNKVSICGKSDYSECGKEDSGDKKDNNENYIVAVSGTGNVYNLVSVTVKVPGSNNIFSSENNDPKTTYVSVATCNDGIQNWNETSIDKGGICSSESLGTCGNGIIEEGKGEECDNGNNNGKDGKCTSTCKKVGGEGFACSTSNDCNIGLCCNSSNICSSDSRTCPPRIPALSSCNALNSSLTNILSNPSPYIRREDVCSNISISVEFDLEVQSDKSEFALNNLNNIIFEKCGSSGISCNRITLSENNIKVINKKRLEIKYDLEQNTYYKVTLKDIRTINNVAMLEPYSWSFKTSDKKCSIDDVSANPGNAILQNIYQPNIELSAILTSNDGKCLSIIAPSGSTYNWKTDNVSKVALCSDSSYQMCTQSSFASNSTNVVGVRGLKSVVNNLVDVTVVLNDSTNRSLSSSYKDPKTSYITVATCDDGIQNWNETSIDRGGVCGNSGTYCGNLLCEDGENYENCPSDCSNMENCGNGSLDEGEVCDGDQIKKGITCNLFSDGTGEYYTIGTIKCNNCQISSSGCGRCGNGVVELTEQCDEGVDNGKYGSICKDDCTFRQGGYGDKCTYSTDCLGDSLCCSAENVCTDDFTKCAPKISEESSCKNKDSQKNNIISNPAPFKNEDNVCRNSEVIVEFDIAMRNNGSENAINNINNFDIIKCRNSSCETGESIKNSGTLTTTENKIIWTKDSNSGNYLDSESYYKVIIKGNVEHIAGVSLGKDYSWIFKTSNSNCSVDSVSSDPGRVVLTLEYRTKQLRAMPLTAGKCLSIVVNDASYDWTTTNKEKIGICENSVFDVNDTCKQEKKSNAGESVFIKGKKETEGKTELVYVDMYTEGKILTSKPDTSKVSYDGYICGDGIKDSNEECDDGGESQTCDISCHKKEIKDGACGSAISRPQTNKPEVNLCISGEATEVEKNSNNLTWNWFCNGTNGGKNTKCIAYEETCGNGKIDDNEFCDSAYPVTEQDVINVCNEYFGEGGYTYVSSGLKDVTCSKDCVLDLTKACIPTAKFNEACTSDDATVTLVNNSFGSGTLSEFLKISGVSEWGIKNGALTYNGNDESLIIVGSLIDKDNYKVKGSVLISDKNPVGIIFNKSKDGRNYYKIEISNDGIRLMKAVNGGISIIDNNGASYVQPGGFSIGKWYNFSFEFKTDSNNSNTAKIIFDIANKGNNKSDGNIKSYNSAINFIDGSKLNNGYFGLFVGENSKSEFDNLNLSSSSNLYEYNNSVYNFGFYYCRNNEPTILSVKDDTINKNDEKCNIGVKCVDRSCRNTCSKDECRSGGNIDCSSAGAVDGDCCGIDLQCRSGKCVPAYTDYGGYSGVYVIPSKDAYKVFVDNTGKAVMVMRVWNVPRMDKKNGEEGSYGPFINFQEWLRRMNLGGSYTPTSRSNFPDDYLIYNQGNSYYFWAPNITSSGDGYINVYVLTYQEDSGNKELFNQIIKNVRFNTNLE